MLTVIETLIYKRHKIDKAESHLQTFFIVDDKLEAAYWSVADAKRAVNGQPLKYEAVDIRHLQ